MPADVVAVIVTYNSAHVVGALLDSLPKALGSLTAEVIVVDNASSDETVAVVSSRQDCRLIERANLGYAAGINSGVAAAGSAEAILVLNPDVRLGPGSVEVMMKSLRARGAGVVAPCILSGDGSLYYSLRREPTLLRAVGLGVTRRPALAEWLNDPSEYEAGQVVDWATGAVLLVSRHCYEAVGGWDESFFLYSEETDFCLRAADLGWRTWYEPAARTEHEGGASGRSGRTQAMLILNRIRLYGRRHSGPATWAYYLVTLAHEVAWMTLGRRDCRQSVAALIIPGRRPLELACSEGFLPR